MVVGDADRQAFVDPEACIELAGAQEQRQRGEHAQESGRRPARREQLVRTRPAQRTQPSSCGRGHMPPLLPVEQREVDDAGHEA